MVAGTRHQERLQLISSPVGLGVSMPVDVAMTPVTSPVAPSLAPCRYGDHAKHQLRN